MRYSIGMCDDSCAVMHNCDSWLLRSRSSVKGFGAVKSLKQKLSQLQKGFEWFLYQLRRAIDQLHPGVRVPPVASRKFVERLIKCSDFVYCTYFKSCCSVGTSHSFLSHVNQQHLSHLDCELLMSQHTDLLQYSACCCRHHMCNPHEQKVLLFLAPPQPESTHMQETLYTT